MRTLMALVAVTVAVLGFAEGAEAGSVANDSPFCGEKEDIAAFARATAEEDSDRMLELVADRSCMVLHAETRASVVSLHDDEGIVKVRLMRGVKVLEGFVLADDFSE